jgi:hypothetical protein
MNDLEEKLIQYEKDAIDYETGKSGAAPSMFIVSPNELLILLNEKNAEIRKAHKVIVKCAEEDAVYGMQPPPYITEWLREYEEMGQ